MPETATTSRDETPPCSDNEHHDTVMASDIVPDVHGRSDAQVSRFEREIREQEDEEVQRTNAYPGATNIINSVHQRTWYLSMDRHASGFVATVEERGKRTWTRRREGGILHGFEPFFVLGRDMERSVVTGRLSGEIMKDEGVEGYVGRKGWRAVVE